ncbi:MAG: prepilin-type N-terminal cleavage/methylation domain-containing protein [Deltaproteobacteria bacterium]|nr:prepilin-type N-terminal cleavage/methylation domain-containing protein [Deltaproteobacteria bacterium]
MTFDSVFPWRKYKEERGFTLVETIVTLVILVIILGIVLSAMRLGIRSWEKGEAVMENAAARRTITSKLAGEISSAYPYKEKTDGGETVLFIGGSKTIGFVTVSGSGLSGLPWGGAKWVYYSVRDGKLTVREKTVPGVDVEADEGGRLIELDEGVAGIAFEYLNKDEWEGSWDANEKKGLPTAVKIKVSFSDGRKAATETVPVGLTHDRQKVPGDGSPAV